MMNNNTIATVNTAIVADDSYIIGKDSKGRDTIIPMITSVSQ
jgi:hypothetical protein